MFTQILFRLRDIRLRGFLVRDFGLRDFEVSVLTLWLGNYSIGVFFFVKCSQS